MVGLRDRAPVPRAQPPPVTFAVVWVPVDVAGPGAMVVGGVVVPLVVAPASGAEPMSMVVCGLPFPPVLQGYQLGA